MNTNKEVPREYQDPAVRRSFAAFYGQFQEKSFYKQMKDSRRAEDLVLIFFSSATKELQKANAANAANSANAADGELKWAVDLHVALFVRLFSSCLKAGGWSSSHSELMKRLQDLEMRLLRHDQNLTEGVKTGVGGRSTTPSNLGPIAPPSTDINDMPMVKTVAKIFDLPLEMVQLDINKNKDFWTEKAALQDFKAYSYHLNLNTPRTLRREDFSNDEAYDGWKKHETQELSRHILTIMQSNPTELAKQSTSTARTSVYGDHSRNYSIASTNTLNSIISENSEASFGDDADDVPYTFFPPDSRGYFKLLMKKCMLSYANDPEKEPDTMFFSNAASALVTECSLRWRMHDVSRVTLLLDAVCDLYKESRLGLTDVDGAFLLFKNAVDPNIDNWPNLDRDLHTRMLREFHDTLLRELYEILQTAYESKAIPIAKVMQNLEEHVLSDPLFEPPGTLDEFIAEIIKSLSERAEDEYINFLKELPKEFRDLDALHVLELAQKVVKWTGKISKRFKHPILEWVPLSPDRKLLTRVAKSIRPSFSSTSYTPSSPKTPVTSLSRSAT